MIAIYFLPFPFLSFLSFPSPIAPTYSPRYPHTFTTPPPPPPLPCTNFTITHHPSLSAISQTILSLPLACHTSPAPSSPRSITLSSVFPAHPRDEYVLLSHPISCHENESQCRFTLSLLPRSTELISFRFSPTHRVLLNEED